MWRGRGLLRKKILKPDTPQVLIRRGEPSDASGVIGCMQSVMDEGIFLLGDYYLMTERAERERLSSRSDLTLVADASREVVGVLTLQRGAYRKNRHTATLGIAIKKEYRGAGLGKKMITEALSWARAEGIRKVNLEVFSSNLNAIGLYKNLGFSYEGVRKGQFMINDSLVDDVLMSVWLD